MTRGMTNGPGAEMSKRISVQVAVHFHQAQSFQP